MSDRTGTEGKIIDMTFFLPPEVRKVPKGFGTIDSFVSELAEDESFDQLLKAARIEHARELSAQRGETLRSLRLTRGYSQADLAAKLGTSQSHVARIENGRDDLRLSTLRRVCEALAIDMNTLDQALRRERDRREA